MRTTFKGNRYQHSDYEDVYLVEELKKTHAIEKPDRDKSYWGRGAQVFLDETYEYDNRFSSHSIINQQAEAPWADYVGEHEAEMIKQRLEQEKKRWAKIREENR
ncbi:MAG TPA: hypothetical protein ENI27_10865, partial [bacterium]|nr:hypothetical protein [bacterium]